MVGVAVEGRKRYEYRVYGHKVIILDGGEFWAVIIMPEIAKYIRPKWAIKLIS